jgi:D-arginine dehydrogenase
VVPLSLASGEWLRANGFLSPRGALYVGRDADAPALGAFMERFAGSGVHINRLRREGVEAHLPGLRTEWTGAVWEPACADIDVARLHQHYLTAASRGGVTLATRTRIVGADRAAEGWRLATERGDPIEARIVVNAAGAWADSFAELAGARALGIQPLRRTVAQLRTDPPPPADLPLVLDIGGQFYFKPESGKLWLSPHDEEPSPPCDAAPEELAVAEAIDRFEQVVDWRVLAVERKWAGLRSFAPDRLPVYGFDPAVEGLFWFAGQGGFGIQTAPAAARLAAQLLTGAPRDAMTERLDASLYDPARF